MANKTGLEKVVYVSWEESEKDWIIRPDGCSLHLNRRDYKIFLKEYWDGMPDKDPNPPDEYSRPAGNPVAAYVSDELYARIKESNHGLRLWKHEETALTGKGALVFGKVRSGWVPVAKE